MNPAGASSPDPGAPALRCVGLTRRFGTGDPVVDGVDLSVAPGEVLGVLGPNGGGKSTLLLLLAGLVRPTQGQVWIGPSPAHQLATRAAGAVGLITAEPGLYGALTLRENLLWFAGLYGRDPQRTTQGIEALAAELGLGPHLDRPASTLSSGQRQKGSLVRALLLAPSVLLFDEPSANLDPLASLAITAQIRARADAGIAVVLCTHDLDAAARICDRVILLDRQIRDTVHPEGPRQLPAPSPLHLAYARAHGQTEPAPGPHTPLTEPAPTAGGLDALRLALHVARREWLEQARHPGTLAVCATLLGLIAGLTLGAMGLLQLTLGEPDAAASLSALLGGEAAGQAFREHAVGLVLSAWNFLLFSQYLGFVGVMAGHALLHDRMSGTLPFLLLAPIERPSLLVGKVLGALGPLTLLTVGVAGLGGLAIAALPVTAPHVAVGPRGLGWWVGLLGAAPAWAAFVAATCAALSSLARDVRLAQQSVWFVVFFVQLLVAFLITANLHSAPTQLAATALGLVAAAVAVGVGAGALAQDLGR